MLVSSQQPHSRCRCFSILADATYNCYITYYMFPNSHNRSLQVFQQAYLDILAPQLKNLADHVTLLIVLPKNIVGFGSDATHEYYALE